MFANKIYLTYIEINYFNKINLALDLRLSKNIYGGKDRSKTKCS